MTLSQLFWYFKAVFFRMPIFKEGAENNNYIKRVGFTIFTKIVKPTLKLKLE